MLKNILILLIINPSLKLKIGQKNQKFEQNSYIRWDRGRKSVVCVCC